MIGLHQLDGENNIANANDYQVRFSKILNNYSLNERA